MTVFDNVATPNWAALRPPECEAAKCEKTAPEKETNMNFSQLEYDVECAEAAIDDGRFSDAGSLIQKATRTVDRIEKAKHRTTVTHTLDTGDPDDWSAAGSRANSAGDDEDPESKFKRFRRKWRPTRGPRRGRRRRRRAREKVFPLRHLRSRRFGSIRNVWQRGCFDLS